MNVDTDRMETSQEPSAIGAVDVGGITIPVGMVAESGQALAAEEEPGERTSIRLASLGSQAAIIGAACTWHHRFSEKLGERLVIGS